MWVKSIREGDPVKFADMLNAWLVDSRFTADVELYDNAVKINNVRLKEKKHYCGNHPNACVLPPRGKGGKNPKRFYLEGADWVDFNDKLNEIADRLMMDCRIQSAQCVIRDRRRRRIHYGSYVQRVSFMGEHWEWERYGDRDNDYKDCIGVDAPLSTFPEGTNGIYERAGYKEED
jgi:hypothetical protein